jgi:hypothetical protein
VALPKRAQPRKSWISTPTWALINKRAMLRQQGKLLKQASRCIDRQIAAGLMGDRQHQIAGVAANIEMHLAVRETKEAWRCLKGWYKTASKTTPTASPMSLAAQTAERVALYRKAPLQGTPSLFTLTRPTFRMPLPATRSCSQLVGDFETGVPRGHLDCRQSTSRCGSAMSRARRRRTVM